MLYQKLTDHPISSKDIHATSSYKKNYLIDFHCNVNFSSNFIHAYYAFEEI